MSRCFEGRFPVQFDANPVRQPRVGQSLTLHGVGPRIQVILRTPTLDG